MEIRQREHFAVNTEAKKRHLMAVEGDDGSYVYNDMSPSISIPNALPKVGRLQQTLKSKPAALFRIVCYCGACAKHNPTDYLGATTCKCHDAPLSPPPCSRFASRKLPPAKSLPSTYASADTPRDKYMSVI